jgi:pyruvate dehydrogenase E2 component (dihydrolipoamide acetyltransferase)
MTIMGNHALHKLTIPKWGLTMEEGTVGAWLVEEGARVEPGTEVVEVETEKSTQAVEVAVSGVLRRKLAAEGETVPVGGAIAVIAEPDVPDAEIDAFIAQLSGGIPAESSETALPSDGGTQPVTTAPAADTTKPMSRMRTAIAKTVTEGWTIPQFPVTMAIDMERAEELCRTLREAGNKVSINDMVIKAAAVALKQHPQVHATLAGDSYVYHDDINIAVAVGREDGLLMPVLKGCQNLTLPQVGEKSRSLIQKVQSGSIGEEEMTGGNFAISNLGMFGVELFAALVPPGLASILAVGAIKDEALVKNGQIAPGRIMRVTLAADHRVVDGLASAGFLVELKRVLQDPQSLVN